MLALYKYPHFKFKHQNEAKSRQYDFTETNAFHSCSHYTICYGLGWTCPTALVPRSVCLCYFARFHLCLLSFRLLSFRHPLDLSDFMALPCSPPFFYSLSVFDCYLVRRGTCSVTAGEHLLRCYINNIIMIIELQGLNEELFSALSRGNADLFFEATKRRIHYRNHVIKRNVVMALRFHQSMVTLTHVTTIQLVLPFWNVPK